MTLVKYLLRGIIVMSIGFIAIWYWLLHTESGAAFAWRQLGAALNGDLTGEFRSGDFSTGVEIEGVKFSSAAMELISNSSAVAINIDIIPLRVEVSSVHLQGVAVTARQSATTDNEATDIESLMSGLRLPLPLDLIDVRVDEIELWNLEDDPILIERVDASVLWQDEILIRRLRVQMADDFILLQGGINLVEPQSIDLGLSANYQSIAIRGNLSGDTKSIKTHELRMEGDAIEAGLALILQRTDGFRATGTIHIDRFDPAGYAEVWPRGRELTGILNLDVSTEYFRLTDSSLAIMNSDAALQLEANIDLATSRVSTHLDWQDLQWPIDSVSPQLKSANGKATLNGVLDDWQIQGSVAMETAEMPDGQFQIEGGGDEDSVAVRILDGGVLGGSLAGEAAYTWRDDQAWSASLQFENLQTMSLLPEWPGTVSGKAEVSGTQKPLLIDASLQEIVGVIRGDSLTAEGSLLWSDGIFTADQLTITHGQNEVFVNGSADTVEGLAFKAGIHLESYVDDMSGMFEASGRWSRARDNPHLSLDLSSAELQVAGQEITELSLSVSAHEEQQFVTLTGSSYGAPIDLALSGRFDDWYSASKSPWRGEITSFSVDLKDEHRLYLEQPASVELSSAYIAVENFCLADDVSSRLCLDALRNSDGRIDLRAEFSSIPVALIEHVADIDASFDQHISGSVNWSGDPDAGATGKGAIEISSGTVTSVEQSSLSVSTGVGEVNFEITNGELLAGVASIPLPGVGAIDARFRVLELTEVVTSEISGQINMVLTDVASVALFMEDVDSASGALRASLDLSGNFSSLLLTGSVELDDGSLSYRSIGLDLSEINLVADLTTNRAIELSGSFRAGEGYGEVISSADYGDVEQPGIRFKLCGENLALVNLPDIHLTAEPDIEFAFVEDSLNINGSLLIPKARITPANLAESRITESEDVVIVVGQLPETADLPQEKKAINFDGNLKIDLGDDVVVDLNIARAKLSGSAVFDWQGEALPVVDGRYDLAGKIQVFGQVLDIAEGAIRFANAPANMPYLRIRAEREIYGNSQVKRAGVLVDGVASHPTIEAYTNPMTTEERALTLLITGSDFDYEQGVGAVDFGTYIAPRLFVSYGVGIFDRDNIISARYDLTKGFGIKASSGDRESGVDLNYRFEN